MMPLNERMRRRESRGTTHPTENTGRGLNGMTVVCGASPWSMPPWGLRPETAWLSKELLHERRGDWGNCIQRNRTLLHSWGTEACLVFHRVSRHSWGQHTSCLSDTRAWLPCQRRARTHSHPLSCTYCLTRSDTRHACGSF